MRQLDEFAARFWAWRTVQQPRTRDDIPRLERPVDWRPRWSADDVARYRGELTAWDTELAAIEPGEQVGDRVEHRLLRSALARVRWELDVVAAWRRQPRFYLDQALGPIFDELLRPGVDAARVARAADLLAAVPDALAPATQNLAGQCVGEFADLALGELAGIGDRIDRLVAGLGAIAPDQLPRLTAAGSAAATALAGFADWLRERRGEMAALTPIGRAQYEWFLTEVACVPYPVEDLLAIGRREFDRATVLEALERNRNRHTPQRPLPASAAEQAAREAADELAVRGFYEQHGLLTQPAHLQHYRNAPLPDYLAALDFLGVTDDLTGPSRLDEDGISYVPEPGPELPYFYAANARDPRAGIVHEGVHYQQLALSWGHPRPVRRHYYDSGANEGIAFYNEELMLASGLFDDAPHTRSIMYNFMRLRALRVEVDVRLAIGEMDVDAAAAYLAAQVPMDVPTAREEAAFFAESPGQALSYQIGKTQVLQLLAEAIRRDPDADLRRLHDSLWLNGNVPIALQRWELLGEVDELARINVAP